MTLSLFKICKADAYNREQKKGEGRGGKRLFDLLAAGK